MLTPVPARRKLLVNLFFQSERKKSGRGGVYVKMTEFILNLKKSQSGREKVSIMMY